MRVRNRASCIFIHKPDAATEVHMLIYDNHFAVKMHILNVYKWTGKNKNVGNCLMLYGQMRH